MPLIHPARVCFIAICIQAIQLALTWGATEIPLGELRIEDGKLGAVASESKICSNIGIDLLKAGGNAADAVYFAKTVFQEQG